MEEENKVVSQEFFMFCTEEYEKLIELFGAINKAGRVNIYELPQTVDKYFNAKDFDTATELVNTLIDYDANPDENWRVSKLDGIPSILIQEKDGKKIINIYDGNAGEGNKKALQIQDIKGFIVIADLQTVIVIPGPESVKSKQFRPNEVLRFQNLLLATMLLCKLENIKDPENPEQTKLIFNWKMIQKNGQ